MTSEQRSLFQHGRGLHGQRTRKVAPAQEFVVHCMVADVLRQWCRPGWRWSHLPFGELRSDATARRLKRMGVNGGWPDFLFIHEHGRTCWMELKRGSNELSSAQGDICAHLRRAGHDVAVVRGFTQAVAQLVAWNVVVSMVPQ